MKGRKKILNISGSRYMPMSREICEWLNIDENNYIQWEDDKDDDGNNILIIKKTETVEE